MDMFLLHVTDFNLFLSFRLKNGVSLIFVLHRLQLRYVDGEKTVLFFLSTLRVIKLAL